MADPPPRVGSGLRAPGSGQLPPAQNPQPTALRRRVLIIGPSNIGDAILTSDVIAEVYRRFPDAHLTLVVGERARALFGDDPRVQTLVNADAFSAFAGRLKLALALWRYQPQILVDLRHTLYAFLLKPLSAWRYLRRPPAHIVHMRDRHLWKLRAQVPGFADGASSKAQEPSLRFTAKDQAHVETLRRRWQLDGARRLVIISPGARSHIKRWTAEGFARVADRLIDEAGCHVLFSGEPEEKPVVEEILGLMSHRAHNAVGLTTIRQLGLLMREAALVITNDSASLHVASSLRVATVAIFGPTDADKYGPTSPRHRVIRRKLFCAPCERPLCRFSHECMRFITADEVFGAVRELLEGGTGGRGRGTDVRSQK